MLGRSSWNNSHCFKSKSLALSQKFCPPLVSKTRTSAFRSLYSLTTISGDTIAATDPVTPTNIRGRFDVGRVVGFVQAFVIVPNNVSCAFGCKRDASKRQMDRQQRILQRILITAVYRSTHFRPTSPTIFLHPHLPTLSERGSGDTQITRKTHWNHKHSFTPKCHRHLPPMAIQESPT